MAAVYAVAPRPAPSALSAAGPSNPLKKNTSLSTVSSATAAASKRKRNESPEDVSGDSAASQPQRKPREGPKKKKANRACYHCQKAHLTCDDSRPCQRCVKRGFANNCTEGHRKKAKYLLDEEELEQLKQGKSAPENLTSTSTPVDPPPIPIAEPFPQNDTMLASSFDPNFSFGSEAANLEYSILSAILGNPSPPETSTTPPPAPPPPQYSSWPSDPIDFAASPRLASTSANSFSTPYGENQMPPQQSESNLSTSPANTAHYLTYPYPHAQRSEELTELSYPTTSYSTSQPSTALHPLQPRYPLDTRPRSPPTVFLHNPSSKDTASRGLLSPPPSTSSPSSTSSVPTGVADIVRPPSCGSKLQTITDRVTAPYDYTEGYHFLMKHLPTRFEKNDILRIVRALAIFRPSLIALQMPLSLDDEIFVERCFQRTLLELDKLMSYSGTPTVVWRRTGEICLVAPEFCMLTEWPLEDLVGNGRKKYIYELFENQSVVEYWENFASHAFENTTQSVYSHCVLLKPSGAPVPSTFCFSIRRDLFDLPSIVIGQWLPLL
ncbi:Transcriptional regulator of nonfermentable carbon utilization [Psilocybe cubensis]|uniref:Transcription activator of gluconeogenesis ERT1 n=2 Tax=Psilocybe cubensis TaxID=181762 RepID=A0A8H7Y2J3_PSICU|nr:Transcriptional regulator of nonfermentable carbon utilization [Psilocybe cubensis]KAH9485128.1 Transcriptional regulator of nonfermentable carbon utilization [Psilocybe cubensis]